jgi:phospholipid/cholesterol/gamma-HCH transport system substrate-binding protein
MKRRKIRELSMEVMVGTFMFAVLLALCIFTIVLSRENFLQKTYPFEVVFGEVMGLRDGDNVVVRGMEIGKIRRLVLQPDGVHVMAALKHPVFLKADYKIEVIASSILGGRYLQINEGSASAPPLSGKAVIHGKSPNDLIALVSDMAADLKNASAKIASGQGTLGKLIYDDALYDNASDVIRELRVAVYDRNLVGNLEDAIENFNQVAEKLNSGQGTLGKLINDDSVYVEAKKTLRDVRMMVDDLRETSPIVTFASIFFGAF